MEESGLGLFCAFSNIEFGEDLAKQIGIEQKLQYFEIKALRCYYFSDYIDPSEEWEDKWPIVWSCKLSFQDLILDYKILKNYTFFDSEQCFKSLAMDQNANSKHEIRIIANFQRLIDLEECKSTFSGNKLISNIDTIRVFFDNKVPQYSMHIQLLNLNKKSFEDHGNKIDEIMDLCKNMGYIHHYDELN